MWLKYGSDHSGTKLAVVWKKDADITKRSELVVAASKGTKLDELSEYLRAKLYSEIFSLVLDGIELVTSTNSVVKKRKV